MLVSSGAMEGEAIPVFTHILQEDNFLGHSGKQLS